MPNAVAQLYSTIPPELKAILVQQLVDWGVAAVRSVWRRWWYTFRRIDKQEALYKWYLKEFVEHFSTIEALDQLVPFTGSLGVDRFLLWPELEGESRRSADKQNSAVQDGEPLLPRKLKATELLTHPLSNKRLFAVEGVAGVGKTTMARALARFAATQALELMERENEDGSQVQYLPLYFKAEDLINLAASAPVGQVSPSGEGAAHAGRRVHHPRQVSPSGEGALKDLLDGLLQKPNRALLVIVDELDEVEGPIRTKALNTLRDLWLPGGNHRYLLLGRPGSISNVPWVREEEAALKLSLKPWGEEEVREYLGRWTKKGGRPHLEVAELDQLVEYIRSRVGLPSPALQVQMVVASYVELKRDGLENPLEQMPATRTELYRHYLRLLLERSEGDKAQQGAGSTAHPADPERRKWLGCLELLLRLSPKQRERARAQRCSANHLPDVAAARARERSCGKLLREGADFAKWWEDRKLCRLGHESLHEFLAAEALARLYQGDPKGFWKDWLHPSIFDPYWQQTLIFAMALMDERDQSALMRGLLALGSCDPISELTKRHLEVMAKAWGAGVRYDQAIWKGWLDSDPHPDLLVTAATNANLRTDAREALVWQAQNGKDEWAKLLALNALAKFNPELAVPTFMQLAWKSENEDVRLQATVLLLWWKPSVAILALRELAKSAKDTVIQFYSAGILAKYDQEASLQALERLAQEAEHEWLRKWADKTASEVRTGTFAQTAELRADITEDEGTVRASARKWLANLKPKPTTATLEQFAQRSEDEGLQLFAGVVLAEQGSDTGIPTLKRLAWEAVNEDLQLLATRALKEFGRELAISTLVQMASEAKGEQVRLQAAQSLVDLKPEVAISTFLQLALEAGEEAVRAMATTALGKMGIDAVLALKELVFKATDEQVRLGAIRELAALGVPPIGCESVIDPS